MSRLEQTAGWDTPLMCRAGLLTESVAGTLDGTALMLSAGAGSVAAGVPLTVMPAPLVAAGGLAMYLESGALRDYLLFVAGALGTGAGLSLHADTRLVSTRTWVVAFTNMLICEG